MKMASQSASKQRERVNSIQGISGKINELNLRNTLTNKETEEAMEAATTLREILAPSRYWNSNRGTPQRSDWKSEALFTLNERLPGQNVPGATATHAHSFLGPIALQQTTYPSFNQGFGSSTMNMSNKCELQQQQPAPSATDIVAQSTDVSDMCLTAFALDVTQRRWANSSSDNTSHWSNVNQWEAANNGQPPRCFSNFCGDRLESSWYTAPAVSSAHQEISFGAIHDWPGTSQLTQNPLPDIVPTNGIMDLPDLILDTDITSQHYMNELGSTF